MNKRRNVLASQKRIHVMLQPSPKERLIQKLGRLFYGTEAEIPKTIQGRMSLLEKGYARKNKNGKLVLTDKGLKLLAGNTLHGYHVIESKYDFDRKWIYDATTYSDIFFTLKKRLGSFKGKRILELGFREADFLNELKKRGSKVSGLDIDPFKQTEGMELVQGDIEKLDKFFVGKRFHAVVCKGVFEPIDSSFSLSRMAEKANKLKRWRYIKESTELRRKINDRVSFVLKKINEKLENQGYLIIETMDLSFVKKWHLKREGFEVVKFQKTRTGNYLLIARRK